MKDYCLRGITTDGQIRYMAALTTGLCEEARRRHDTWPVATAALGRLLTAGAFFGLNLKGQDTVTLRIEGDGPLESLVVVADAQGALRGYVAEPHVELAREVPGKLPVGKGVGEHGTLYVLKDLGLKEPYSGSVGLLSGEIADDIACYLLESEQIPAAVALGVQVLPDGSVGAAGGYLFELLPGASKKAMELLEKNIMAQPPVSKMLELGLLPEDMVAHILSGIAYQELERTELHFSCNCNRERLAEVLLSIGKEELASLYREQGEAEAVCRFCGEKYYFSGGDLKALLAEASNEEP